MNKISVQLKQYNQTHTIEIDREDLDMQELLQLLIVPLLKSAGYGESTINKYIKVYC